MLHVSNNKTPRTIGAGASGITDKILNGSDSRQINESTKQRSKPPTLQDCIFQALCHELVRIVLVDRSDIVGKLLWYNNGRFCIRPNPGDPIVMCASRVMSLAPIEVDEVAVPLVTEKIKKYLLTGEERSSKLQSVKRRLQEKDNRIANAAKFANR